MALTPPNHSDSPKRLTGFTTTVFVLYILSLATSMGGMEFFSTLLCLCLIALGIFYKRPPSLPPFYKSLTLFVIIATISILLGDAPPREKFYDFGRLRFFLLYGFLSYGLSEFLFEKKWVRVLTLVTAVIGVYGVVQHFIPIDIFRSEGNKIIIYAIPEEKLGPLTIGSFNHHLTFSNIYLLYAPIFLSLGLYGRKKSPLLIGLSALIYLDVLWTQSRVAWLAIPTTLAVVLLKRGFRPLCYSIGAMVLVLALTFLTDSGFRERVTRTFNDQQDSFTLGPRIRLWHAQLSLFKENPLFGVGFNNNERQAKEVVDRLYPNRTDNFYGHAHSTPLQILATTGVFGFLTYLWIWWQVFQRGFQIYRRSEKDSPQAALALGIVASFVGFQIQGLTQWNFGDAEVLHNIIFFWAVLSAMTLPPNQKSYSAI